MFSILTGAQNKILRTPAEPVQNFDEKLQEVVDSMIETMLNPDTQEGIGVGLAANQVGLLEEIIIVTFNVETRKKHKIVPMINPRIVWLSDHKVIMEEGCLSLPGQFGKVKRPSKVKVQWQTPEGNYSEKKLEGWDARIFLHEYDHLRGKLFIDY